jgi:hypothetical protein
MIDLSEFTSSSERPYLQCSVKWVLSFCDDEQLAKAQAAIMERTIESSKIAKVVSGWTGHKLLGNAVRRHRNGECRCDRPE